MNNVIQIFKKFPAQAIGIAVVLVTLFTSSASVSAIVKSATSQNLSVPEVKSAEIENVEDQGIASRVKQALSTPTSHPVANLIAAIATPKPTPVDTGNLCIITVFGKEYDVTTLQTTHSGGNVFNCGADNTSLYQSAHGTNVSRIAKYAYSGTAVTTTSGSTNNMNTATGNGDGDDDGHEEEEHGFEKAWEKAKQELENEDHDD